MERTVARVALFAALIAALGLIPQIVIPFAGGVPITAQTLGIMLAGLILGPWRALLAVLVFLAVVAMGAPLLAGGRGGLGVFAGPTVGFLIGWPVAAIVTGWLFRALAGTQARPGRFAGKFWPGVIASIAGGILALYLFGVVGMAVVTDLSLAAATLAVLIFVPGDVLKAVIAALIAQQAARARPDLLE